MQLELLLVAELPRAVAVLAVSVADPEARGDHRPNRCQHQVRSSAVSWHPMAMQDVNKAMQCCLHSRQLNL
jgi:hypothetical protein